MDDFKVEVKSEWERKEQVEVGLRERIEREAVAMVRIDYQVEILEEARQGTQQHLVSFQNERRLETARVRLIGARYLILES